MLNAVPRPFETKTFDKKTWKNLRFIGFRCVTCSFYVFILQMMMQLVQIEPKISVYGAIFCSHGCFSIATLTPFDERRRRHAMLGKWNATSTILFLMFLGSMKSHEPRGCYGPSMEALRSPQPKTRVALHFPAMVRFFLGGRATPGPSCSGMSNVSDNCHM